MEEDKHLKTVVNNNPNYYRNKPKEDRFIYAGFADNFKTDGERVFVVVDGEVYFIPRCTKIIIESAKCHDVVFRGGNYGKEQ